MPNLFEQFIKEGEIPSGNLFDQFLPQPEEEPVVDKGFVPEEPTAEFFPEFAGGGAFTVTEEEVEVAETEKRETAILEEQRRTGQGEFTPRAFGEGLEIRERKPEEVGKFIPAPEAEALERNPIVDPVSVMAGAFGAAGRLGFAQAVRAGMGKGEAVLHALFRGSVNAGLAGGAELVIAGPTSAVEVRSGSLALTLNIALGVGSGLTVETALEKYIIKRLGTGKLADSVMDATRAFLKTEEGAILKANLESHLTGQVTAEDINKVFGIYDTASKVISGGAEESAAVFTKAGKTGELILQNAFDEAQLTLKGLGSLGFNQFLNPQQIKAITVVGAYHLERTGRDFAKWSAKMMEEMGPHIKPFLKDIYDSSTDMLAQGAVRAAPKVKRKKPLVTAQEQYAGPPPPIGSKNDIGELVTRYAFNEEDSAQLRKYAGSVNIDRITSEDEVKVLMNKIYQDNQSAIDRARGGVKSHEQTLAAAQRSGTSEKAFREAVSKKGIKPLRHEEAVAMSMLNAASANRVTKLQKVAQETGSDADIFSFLTALEQHRIIQTVESGIASETGRALQARRILKSPEQIKEKNLKRMLDALGGRDIALGIAVRMSDIDPNDYVAVNKFVADVTQHSRLDKLYEFWVNSLLSSPATHARNIVSNTAAWLGGSGERVFGAVTDKAISAIKGTPRTRYMGEAVAHFMGGINGMRLGWANALKAFVDEIPVFDPDITKLEMGFGRAIKGTKGRIIRIPGRALIAADEYFKGWNYMSDLYVQAYRKSVKEGLKGSARMTMIQDLVTDPTDEMIDIARKLARNRTFQTELMPGFTKDFSAARSRNIFLKYLAPFVRTPRNIAAYSLERTPLGFYWSMREAIQKNPNVMAKFGVKAGSQESIADQTGKALFGTVVAGGAYALAAGVIPDMKLHGGGPKDFKERQTLYRTGWSPYSLQIGDKYISLGQIEPFGSILGMTADFYEHQSAMSDKEKENLLGSIITGITRNLTSKTYTRGLTDFFTMINDPGRYSDRWMNNLLSTALPRIVATTARAVDPTLRATEGMMENFQSQIPGWSKWLYPKRDAWGKPVQRSGDVLGRIASPIAVSEGKGTELDVELLRLMQVTGQAISTPRTQVGSIELTPEQYDTFLFEAGRLGEQFVGNIIRGSGYERLDDELKMNLIKNQYSKAVDIARKKLFIKRKAKYGKVESLTETANYKTIRKQLDKEQ